MADYISREALKEAFGNADADVCESYPDGHCDWGFGRSNINAVIDGIPAADVEPVRRWIPCSEKMPETNGKDASYLVYVPSFGAVDIADYHPDVDEWTFMGLPVTVTHWMPMPEPPEEGDAGNAAD